MKILVTGGAGFIGSHVVDAYIKAGHQVTALDNLSTGSRQNLNPDAEFVEMDVADPGLAEFMAEQNFDLVNHHAAQVSVPQSMIDPQADLKANGQGVLNLLTASAESGVKRFIFISSGGAVYGEQKNLPTAENALPDPMSPYAAHKLLGECYCNIFSQNSGMETVILRYANVYGPRQVIHAEAGVVMIFMTAIGQGKKPTIYRYEDQPKGMVRDYLYVGDAVRANLAALHKGKGKAYNIGTTRPTSTLELYEAICRIAKVKPECSFGPPRQGDIKNSLVDINRAQRELDWQPKTSLEQGLALTWDWQRHA